MCIYVPPVPTESITAASPFLLLLTAIVNLQRVLRIDTLGHVLPLTIYIVEQRFKSLVHVQFGY